MKKRGSEWCRVGRFAAWSLGLLLAAGSASAAESGAAQKCLNAMNKAGISVRKAQAGQITSCIKKFADIGASAVGTCIAEDSDGKVAKAATKIQAAFDKSCSTTTPTFGLTSPTVVASLTAGVDSAAVLLLTDLLSYEGSFDLALDLDCTAGQAQCDCQRPVLAAAQKTTASMGSLWLKCAKSALKGGNADFPDGAASRADLARCLTDPSVELSLASAPLVTPRRRTQPGPTTPTRAATR